MTTSQDLSSWIHELVQMEGNPHLRRGFEPDQWIEEATISFLGELKVQLASFVKIFNSQSDSGVKYPEIKLYAISDTLADFMLFRSQMKLLFTQKGHGIIRIALQHHQREKLQVDGTTKESFNPDTPVSLGLDFTPQDLTAQFGAFREVFWTFHGEKINATQAAKFYFSEFIYLTRTQKKLLPGNQLLLNQIKALLQEQGLDL